MKTITTVLLSVLLLLSTVLFSQTPIPSAGSGTAGDPYQIATLDNLAWLSITSAVWGSDFIQTADIDATATNTWNGVTGFSPIGLSSPFFTGNYNGDGYTISNLYINRPSTNNIGLFGRLNIGNIQDLGVVNVNISGGIYTGGFGGSNGGSTILNCYCTGNILGTINTGGLMGGISGGLVSKCYFIGDISGIQYVGGLLGSCIGSVSDCYSTGSVSGNFHIGGLIGSSDAGTISNSYSTGLVTGNIDVGGFMGLNNNSTTTDCFWDTETSGQPTSAAGTGKTTVEMKTQGTFDPPWNFISTWGIDPSLNNGYPALSWQIPPIPLSNSAIYLGILLIGGFIVLRYRRTIILR